MTQIRTPGPLDADDLTWLKSFQSAYGGQPDGKFGRQTLDLVKAALAERRQPDDPGAQPRPEQVSLLVPVLIGAAIALVITVFASLV